ncbi:peptide chain release factor H [Marinibactrum halimedae]|uniref:Peptide chain release factor H n=1 Tax=Marinibactrum halimedae TaxID=1444977 RepID=A0AA37WQR8_9GAMM|nr:peptide chain release factor H [Marinibactrum halimedae]MCD9458860.1 peptide chain release factor H [Marinibactrum halimedae]GLS27712.1 peptide chain release factor H [Marinibactrum halimedae]
MKTDNRKNNHNTLLQVSAGQGPKECGWVVAQVIKAMEVSAKAHQLKLNIETTVAYDKHLRKQSLIEPDAYLSVIVQISGTNRKAFIKEWEGTIQWRGESHYRPKHKRQNWFVSVNEVTPLKDEHQLMEELEKEVQFSSTRASGPGGQHVNKTSSAVQLTHPRTGIQLKVDTERSQHRNKQLALKRLQTLLDSKNHQTQSQQTKDRWQQHFHVGRGNAVKIFVGSEFKAH